MKKLLIKLFALVLSVVCCLGFIACNDADNGDGGSGTLTKAQYATAFGSATGVCKDYMLTPALSALSFSVSDSDLTEINNPGVIYATIWFMDFLKNVCNTESFTLMDGYAECYVLQINANSSTDEFNVRFKMSYDKENGVIKSDVFACEPEGYVYYFDFTVNYNFSNNTLNSFITQGAIGSSIEHLQVMYLDYRNNTLKSLNTTSDAYASVNTAMTTAISNHNQMTFGENLPDYSVQYNSANPYLQ